MKFRRSAGTPRPPQAKTSPADRQARRPGLLRRIRWPRWILLTLILGGVGWYLVSGQISVIAQGVISGQTTNVAAISRGRVASVPVDCGDAVSEGQTVAVLGNEERLIELDARYSELQGELRTAREALSPALRESEEAAAAARRQLQAARARVADRAEARETYRALFEERAITRTRWRDVQETYQDALAERDVAQAQWRQTLASYDRRESELLSQIAELRDRLREIDQQRQRATRTVLTAPRRGTVARCDVNVGEVVEAGQPLFTLFRPDTAQVVAYLKPTDVRRINIGSEAEIQINGMSGTFQGRVRAILPLVENLPPALSRYFWQDQEWQQYAPVEIELPDLSPAQRRQLTFGARSDVTIQLWRPAGVPLDGVRLPDWLPI
jgi:membrane fusion protein (multidrug efflux system)